MGKGVGGIGPDQEYHPSLGSLTESGGELVGSLDGPCDLSTAAKRTRGFGE